nr:TMV resistance protein N-like [Quercus suber]
MGTFAQAFVKHEEKENIERVEKWRDALRQVGNLAGRHLRNTRSEIEDIKDIVGKISLNLKYDAFPYITKDLVGIYSRMVGLESCLVVGSNDVRFIGIWGMGGMDKTTLARVVYYMVSKKFEACSFIEHVREKSEKDGLLFLQQKLIYDILMETNLKIKDEYDGALKIMNKELSNKSLLKIMYNNVVWMHDLLEEMGKNIVRQDYPDDSGKHSRLWRFKDIDNVLKQNKNFDKLKFIDLTNSWNLIITPDFTRVPNLEKLILKNCKRLHKLHPSIGILKKLILLNLQNCLRLNCLPSIGNMECLQKLFLDYTTIMELPSSVGSLIGLTSLTLSNSKNLVCLPSTICSLTSLESLDLSGSSKLDNLPKTLGNVKGLKKINLSGTAIKELPSSIEHLTDLTSLTLLKCYKLVCLPNTKCGFKFRGALDLSGHSKFKKLPENLWIIEGLEKLDLSRIAIEELPSSIERLTSLTLLTLKGCKNLVCLPSTICSLKLLESLDLSGCSKFDNLPENLGNVEALKKLDLCGTAIKELPSSIERLTCLTSLTLLYCYKLTCLPNTTCGFKFRGALDLSACSRFKKLPENSWIIEGLKMLDLSKTVIEELASSIKHLTMICTPTCH